MEGSNKINVVPPTAVLELDCRLLPDQDPQQLLYELVAIAHDYSVTITIIMGFTRAVSIPNTILYEAIGNAAIKNMRNAVLISSVSTSFTDSHFFYDAAIVSYGFVPFLYLDIRGSRKAWQ